MTHDRRRPSKPRAIFDWVTPAVVALAIGFQIQTDLTIGENAIRVSAADLMSPLLAILILIDIRRRGLSLPSWRVPRLWLWLGALTVVMTVALIVGRVNTGAWISWAVYNKYLGWFALIWYFVLGGWFFKQDNSRFFDSFTRAFLIFCWANSIYSLLDYMALRGFGFDFPGGNESFRLYGFMKNPNAFGLLVAAALAIQMPFMARRRLFSRRVHLLGATVLMTALALSFSRSAWTGATIAILLGFFLKGIDTRRFAAAFGGAVLATVLVLFVYNAAVKNLLQALDGEHSTIQQSIEGTRVNIQERLIEIADAGSTIRFETNRRAFELWREHPVLGIGLGGFLWPQHQRNEEHPVIIHNTYLWWLTEFGLIGFTVFVGFFVVCIRSLARGLQEIDTDAELLRLATLGAIAVIAGASLGMESMYQRHVWFLLGWALVLPAVGNNAVRRAEPVS